MKSSNPLGSNSAFVTLCVCVSPRLLLAIARLKSAKAALMGLRVTTNADENFSFIHCAHLLVSVCEFHCSKILANEAFLQTMDANYGGPQFQDGSIELNGEQNNI